ncbi:MAG: helix-turn-helix domain-containing protein [Clostridiales Family XIII bacterium]|jgi:transcriptional regulator with XRE-family HTH domain|nr:helix-turn-helix domain-containing protein [Clostridiales Family XIII bacterium]
MLLSDALRRFRKTYGVTQKQAAVAAGVTERVYQAYEYGKVVPTANVLIAMADFFDVSLDYLVGRSGNPGGRGG